MGLYSYSQFSRFPNLCWCGAVRSRRVGTAGEARLGFNLYTYDWWGVLTFWGRGRPFGLPCGTVYNTKGVARGCEGREGPEGSRCFAWSRSAAMLPVSFSSLSSGWTILYVTSPNFPLLQAFRAPTPFSLAHSAAARDCLRRSACIGRRFSIQCGGSPGRLGDGLWRVRGGGDDLRSASRHVLRACLRDAAVFGTQPMPLNK